MVQQTTNKGWGYAGGSGLLSGAASGAAIGSLFPGLGTLIGAGVGAVVGGVSGVLSNQKSKREKVQSLRIGPGNNNASYSFDDVGNDYTFDNKIIGGGSTNLGKTFKGVNTGIAIAGIAAAGAGTAGVAFGQAGTQAGAQLGTEASNLVGSGVSQTAGSGTTLATQGTGGSLASSGGLGGKGLIMGMDASKLNNIVQASNAIGNPIIQGAAGVEAQKDAEIMKAEDDALKNDTFDFFQPEKPDLNKMNNILENPNSSYESKQYMAKSNKKNSLYVNPYKYTV